MTDAPPAVLVTGACGGIGTALCRAFAAAGYRTIGTDRVPATHESAVHVTADLAALVDDAERLAHFRQEVLAAAGGARLGAIVNNAAIQVLGGVRNLDLGQCRASLDLNVLAPLALARCFVAELEAAQGAIVNIGSVHAHVTKPGFLAYAMSKSALSGLTRALALDLAAVGVRVNEVRPGATATAMLQAGFAGDPHAYARLADCQPLGRIAEPGEVADLAVYLCSQRAQFITGAVFTIDGGISARLHDPV